MPLQTTYTVSQDQARAGLPLGEVESISGVVAAGATAIQFGRVVAHDGSSNDKATQLFSSGNTVSQIKGIALRDSARQPAPGQTDGRYTEYEQIGIHAEGQIWVECVDAIPAAGFGAAVNVVSTAGANQGKVSYAAAGGVMPNAKFMSVGTSAGDLVLIQING